MGESNPRIKKSLPAQGRKFAGIQGKSAHAIEFLSQLFRGELHPEVYDIHRILPSAKVNEKEQSNYQWVIL